MGTPTLGTFSLTDCVNGLMTGPLPMRDNGSSERPPRQDTRIPVELTPISSSELSQTEKVGEFQTTRLAKGANCALPQVAASLF